jgi:hypothetical protein
MKLTTAVMVQVMTGLLALLGMACKAAAAGSEHLQKEGESEDKAEAIDESTLTPVNNTDRPTSFALHGPERTLKQWAGGIVTGCRQSNHLAFTFDDGVKYPPKLLIDPLIVRPRSRSFPGSTSAASR